jgi:peptidylprolyl isomerase
MELQYSMKHTILILMMAASAAAASAQTPAKPAAPAANAATTPASAAKPAATAAKTAAATSPAIAAVIKEPAGIPQYKGLQKPIFTVALRYKEIKIGTGAVAEPNKLYKVFYTGWRAADGVKFDSTDDHPRPPLKDKDGKPVLGDDGKPKLGDLQPMPFAQGVGGTIPGFDQGFAGMKIGGKRRLFIPWQLAYGTRTIPDRGPSHPGIPPKSNLIFDVELVDVTELPPTPTHPPMGMPGGRSMPPRPGTPGAPPTPAQPGTPPPAPVPPAPGAPPKASTSATPAAPNAAPAPAPTTPAPGQPATPAAPTPPPAPSPTPPPTPAPTPPPTPAQPQPQ